jgi:hypothetical protein
VTLCHTLHWNVPECDVSTLYDTSRGLYLGHTVKFIHSFTPGGTSATRHDIGPQVLSCGELQPPAGWHTTSHAFQQHVAASASHITPASLHELLLHSPSLLSVLSGRAACSCKDACAHAMHVGMLQDAGHFEPSPRPSTQGQPCTMTPLAATAVTTV